MFQQVAMVTEMVNEIMASFKTAVTESHSLLKGEGSVEQAGRAMEAWRQLRGVFRRWSDLGLGLHNITGLFPELGSVFEELTRAIRKDVSRLSDDAPQVAELRREYTALAEAVEESLRPQAV